MTPPETDIYPSRVGGEPALIERADPVTYAASDKPAPLGATLAGNYARDGFFVQEDLFEAGEVDHLVAELARLRDDFAGSDDENVIREPGGDTVRSIFDVHRSSAVFERLVRDSRLVDVARYLLGDDVYVHQSRLNYKPGFHGKEFYWHSDFETWHVEDGMPRMRALSVSITLTRNTSVNGPLMLVPGSHRAYISCPGQTPENHHRESLRRQTYGVPPDDLLHQLVDEGGIVSVTGPAGTATFFECNTIHGSNGNISPFPRANAFIVYNSVRNRPVDPFGGRPPRPGYLAERRDFQPVESVSGTLG